MPDHPEIYRSQAAQYDALVSREDYQGHILPALQKIVALEGLEVAEFGAGTGRLTRLLAPRVRFIHAFDISPHMLEEARITLTRSGRRNWRARVSDHRHVPLADASVDLAISGWSVCYLVVDHPDTWQAELAKALDEMRRVLRPGGTLILLETQGTAVEQPQPPPHLAGYFAYLEGHGFQKTWIRTDYRFESRQEAESLARFFFGDAMVDRITQNRDGIVLPECTGIWWIGKGTNHDN